ncbi:MAG: glycosyltransferase [Alphaproteobacteria bacterium]|nr:glycosyltransferase [Alphaproteobacteria bacterium]
MHDASVRLGQAHVSVPARGPVARARWLFYPDYRGSVPYQDLLARSLEPWAASGAGTVTDALEAAATGPVVFHLHQEDAVTAGLAGDAAREAVGLFLAELDAFRACGGRLVWTMHNAAPHEDREPELSRALRAALAVRADLLHVHGAIAARLARALGAPEQRIVIVPHPDLAPGYPDDVTDAAARRYFRLGPEHRVFAFMGAMRAYKGLDVLARAFDQLAPARPEARLIMAGRQAGWVEARYLAPSPQLLLVPRHVEDATVQYVLRAADFVVLPYRRILSSGSAALALGFGRPLIVPDLPPLLEVVRPGREAIVYRAGDADELTAALERACAMPPDERQAMRDAALAGGRSVNFDDLAAALRVAADFPA